MKSNKIKNSFISTLVVCGLLLIASQAALAAKGGKPPPVPPVEIYSVVVELFNSKIVVTGNGLNNVVADVSLGAFSVPAGDIFNIDDNELQLPFSADMADAVSVSGNYLLTLNGTSISVYFSSPVFFEPGTVSCPCEVFWEDRRITAPNSDVSISGYASLTPSCAFQSSSGDQVAVWFQNDEFGDTQHWVLTSEYNDASKRCRLVYDEDDVTLISPQEHAACSTYLIDTYIIPYPPADCGSFPPFP